MLDSITTQEFCSRILKEEDVLKGDWILLKLTYCLTETEFD